MNIFIFLLHIALISLLVLGALRLGKEALIVLFCLQGVIANLLVLKQMTFLGLTITCTDAYIIGSYFSLSLLHEYYGQKVAHKAVSLSFFLLLVFILFSLLHLAYRPSPYDTYHPLYVSLLKASPRICLASLLVAFTAQKFNIYLQGALKKSHLPKILSLSLPIAASQLYDTLAFSFLGLYGIASQIFHVILVSYLLKIITLSCMTPVTLLSKKFFSPQPS